MKTAKAQSHQVRVHYLLVMILLIATAFGTVAGNAQLVLLCNILCLLISIFSPIHTLLPLILIVAPNDSMLMVGDVLSLTTAMGAILLIKLLIHGSSTYKIDKIMIFSSLGLMVAAIISTIYANDNYAFATMKIIIMVLAFSLAKHCYDYNKNLSELFFAYILGVTVMALIALAIFLTGLDDYPRLRSLGGDPNYFALYLAFAMSLLLIYIFRKECFSVTPLLLFMLFFLCGALSQSRGFFVCVLPALLLLIAGLLSNFAKNVIVIFGSIIIVVIVSLFISENTDTITELISRFTSSETAGGSGRLDLWATYAGLFLSSLTNCLFGVSTASATEAANAIAIFGTENIVCHNIYIELFCMHGLIYAIFYLVMLWRMRKQISNPKRHRYCIPLLTIMLGYTFLNGVLNVTFIVLVLLAVCAFEGENKPFLKRDEDIDVRVTSGRGGVNECYER